MDYSFTGSGLGTDQIFASTPLDYDNSVFVNNNNIKKDIKWPHENMNFPEVELKPKLSQKIDTFSNPKKTTFELTDDLLIMFLLVILVVFCSLIYNTTRQIADNVEVLKTLIIMIKKK